MQHSITTGFLVLSIYGHILFSHTFTPSSTMATIDLFSFLYFCHFKNVMFVKHTTCVTFGIGFCHSPLYSGYPSRFLYMSVTHPFLLKSRIPCHGHTRVCLTTEGHFIRFQSGPMMNENFATNMWYRFSCECKFPTPLLCPTWNKYSGGQLLSWRQLHI